MSKMQCHAVCWAMFQDQSEAYKILRPNPHWEMQVIQSVKYHFLLCTDIF